MKRLLYVALALLVSCSSPEMDGRKAAKEENRCSEKCIEAIQKLESEFVTDFDPRSYTRRSEAITVYKKEFERIGDDYRKGLDAVAIQKSKLKGKYANDYKKMERFEEAYKEEVNNEISESATLAISSETIPASVIASINSIIPPKPDARQIMIDLSGHTLSEGFERKDCYFSEQWKRTIGDKVTVKDFNLEEVLDDNNRDYSFVASMVLQEQYLSYNARAQIYYVLPDGEDWKIDFVKSLGMRIIQTHKYEDCIRCAIEDDGWGGIDALFITNTSEAQLLVIGHIIANKEKRNFSQLIAPGEKKQVGGLFGGGNVTDYTIVAVERES